MSQSVEAQEPNYFTDYFQVVSSPCSVPHNKQRLSSFKPAVGEEISIDLSWSNSVLLNSFLQPRAVLLKPILRHIVVFNSVGILQ
jgi:hypothetical protein